MGDSVAAPVEQMRRASPKYSAARRLVAGVFTEVPPRFQDTVVVYGARPGRYLGEAANKQEAKRKAAEAAVHGFKA